MERKPGKCASNHVITMQFNSLCPTFSLRKQRFIPKLGQMDTTTCGYRAQESAEWLRLHLQL